MAEISNRALALLVVAALVVVMSSTAIQLNRLGSLGTPVGFATDSDTGTVSLAINSSLNIQVPVANSTIDFGTCSPNASGTITLDSNDSSVDDSNCTGAGAEPEYIQLRNIGNVPANITLAASEDVTSFLPGTGSNFEVAFLTDADCTGVLQESYTNLTVATASIEACTNMTVSGALEMSVRVTIPPDTAPNSGTTSNILTFTAVDDV